MGQRVAGKVTVVTGGAQGIGSGIATMLAREGARVVIGDIRADLGEATAEALRSTGGEAMFQEADLADEAQCLALITRAVDAYGRLDALVNNVGWFPRATLEETTTELWERVLALNLRSHFYCCKHAVPHLRAAGGGSIVNIGSINGIQALSTLVAYGAAKGGLLSLTRTIAGAFAADRIRCNYVIPGWVLTDTEVALHRGHGIGDEELQRAGRALPLGRHQTPEDAAYAVLYLVSDESSQVTGTVVQVDAGVTALPIQPQTPYVR